MEPYEVVLFLLGFGSILFLSYVTTRYLAGKSARAMKGKYLNIIETISLGADKRIHLVKTGDKYILIASTAKSIEFLTTLTLDDEEAAAESAPPGNPNVFDFKALFEKYMNSYKTRKSIAFRPEADPVSDRPEGGKFRFNLEKLKNITQRINAQKDKDGDEITNEK